MKMTMVNSGLKGLRARNYNVFFWKIYNNDVYNLDYILYSVICVGLFNYFAAVFSPA